MANPRPLLDDCFLHDKDRLRHGEALAILRERVTCVAGMESIPLEASQGRILAEGITAPRDVPQADNSAVDGYAFRFSDYEAAGGFFRLERRIAAGHPSNVALGPAGTARIFTGALMPPGADTVAMQEDCEPHEQDGQAFVIVPPGLKPGANRRRAGEDVAAGSLMLRAGKRLGAPDIAAIASTGKADVCVHQRLKVGLLSTGDEIRRPGSVLEAGEVYDSNHFLLRALAETMDLEIEDLGALPDDPGIIERTIADASQRCNVILTTGGASRGEEDHILSTLDTLGSRHMWQLAIKPGRPMMFGQIGPCVFLGLPGNPVAAHVCFFLYARPVLSALGGGDFIEPRRFQVPAEFEVPRKKADRREFYRGILGTDPNGRTIVRKFERDGSGLITGLREADGLIEIPEEATSVERGQLVDFLPF